MAPTDTPSGLLAAALRRDAARPLLTFYDDASGERTELSVATFDNWVAKTANLLQDGLAVEPAARVAIRLPVHWQAAVWLAACWSVGAVAVPAGPAAAPAPSPGAPSPPPAAQRDADVLVTALPELTAHPAPAGATDVIALALRPLALPGPGVPPGVLDYDVEVRGYGDRFAPYLPVPPSLPALEIGGEPTTGADLVRAAHRAARGWGLEPGARLLVTEPLTSLAAVLGGLLAPLAAGASVVLCRHLDACALPDRLARERVTGVLASPAQLPALKAAGSGVASPGFHLI